MARAGVASRRDAERLILEGRVKVNGQPVTSPALDVKPSDRVTLDGKPIEAPQETRLWLYYKPIGLVTSEKDEKGRQTVFDSLPREMPRVMSVGRLDLNSEGLLLLTNDGGLKRRLELPETGWLRKYRVRVNGQPNDLTFDPLRRGIVIDGEDFQPMEVKLDRQQGANAWLTVGIREGKNREIRRAMAAVGLTVNRLIRVSYGPFRLDKMEAGQVAEVKRRVLRDQLGALLTGEEEAPRKDRSDKPRKPRSRPTQGGEGGERRSFGDRPPREGVERRSFGDRPERGSFGDRPRKPYGDRPPRAEGSEDRPRKPYGDRPERGSFGDRPRKPYGDRPPRAEGSEDRPRKPYGDRPERGSFGDRPRKPYGDRPPRAEGSEDRPRKPYGDRPERGSFGDRPRKP
ncbi:pseudouridine synthase, partial [Paracoccus zhouxuedongae]